MSDNDNIISLTGKGMAKRMIWVTFTKEGMHCYPAAATDPKLATGDEYDVSFLAHPHRHIFHFRVAIEVFHDDRDIEFIQFKRWLMKLFEGELNVDYKSCEMIADDLYREIATIYPGRDVTIHVSEDGENGCEIQYQTLDKLARTYYNNELQLTYTPKEGTKQ